MAALFSERKWKALSLGATLSLCLFLFQLAVAIGAPPRVLGAEAGYSSISASLCDQSGPDSNKAPSPSGHLHKDCLACALGQAGMSFDAAALTAKSGVLAPFGAVRETRSPSAEVSVLLAAGFASSWSSRAPPLFS
ncbi:MAG: hypothetical protein WB816_13435 [Methylocystis sp.]